MQQEYPFQPRDPEEAAREKQPQIHVFGDGVICDTDTRATPSREINLRPNLSSMRREGLFHYGRKP
jgi:hypothetical protein